MRPYFTGPSRPAAPAKKSALPYPMSTTIRVFRDDGNWPEKAFLRSDRDRTALYRTTYQLPFDDFGDVDLTYRQWVDFADRLQVDHPDCVFLYVS